MGVGDRDVDVVRVTWLPLFGRLASAYSELDDVVSALLRCREPEAGRDREHNPCPRRARTRNNWTPSGNSSLGYTPRLRQFR